MFGRLLFCFYNVLESKSYTLGKPVYFSSEWCHISKENAFVWWASELSMWVAASKNLLCWCQTAYSLVLSFWNHSLLTIRFPYRRYHELYKLLHWCVLLVHVALQYCSKPHEGCVDRVICLLASFQSSFLLAFFLILCPTVAITRNHREQVLEGMSCVECMETVLHRACSPCRFDSGGAYQTTHEGSCLGKRRHRPMTHWHC